MKNLKTFCYCEYCDHPIESTSPPSKESYNNAEIHIIDGTILLPDFVVKRRHKDGYSDSHSVDISGHYCDSDCLAKYLKEIMK